MYDLINIDIFQAEITSLIKTDLYPKNSMTAIFWSLLVSKTLGLRQVSASALWSTIKLQYQAALVPNDLFVCNTVILEN